jgi:hypothetical protein
MTKKLFYLFVLVGALLIGCVRKVQAQIAESVDVNIPFQFHAGGKELPAGKYNIRSVSSTDDSSMEIRSAEGEVVGLFETERSDVSAAMKDNELVFDQVGDNYFLSQIVDGDKGIDTEVVNPHHRGKQEAAQYSTGRNHILAFLHAF